MNKKVVNHFIPCGVYVHIHGTVIAYHLPVECIMLFDVDGEPSLVEDPPPIISLIA